MGKTIAIFNQKGGVGKTTSCINFAACLGAKEKRRFLLMLTLRVIQRAELVLKKQIWNIQHTIYLLIRFLQEA